jgi:ubiquinone/menaquinone biosynthesis C-methylase UbiE
VTGRRTHKVEKLARIFDDEILPVWANRFGRLILRGLTIPPKATILDVSCGTGYPALEIARKMDEQSRLVAIDSSSALLDVARKKAAELPPGRRIFFRTERAQPRLPFTADVFDIVLSNLGIVEFPSATRALRDFARVAKPGGRVLASLPLKGSWQEFHDIYREVLVKHDKHPIIERLDKFIAGLPDRANVERWLASAGLEEPRVEVEEFTLLFRSAREFFFAPVVEYGPLPHWKAIAGHGQELQDVFWHIKEAIDAYFGGRAFEVTIQAGCLSGRKGEGVETVELEADAPDEQDDGEPIATHEVELVDEDEVSDEEILEHDEAGELDAFREPDDR